MKKLKILFVCLGNICRSPMAEGALSVLLDSAGLAEWVDVDSAGLHSHFHGQPPDERARRAASRHQIDISGHRAREISRQDFEAYDWVLAVDRDTLTQLQFRCPANLQHKIRLLLNFTPTARRYDVPDPYYGEQQDFDAALELIEEGVRGLFRYIQERHRYDSNY